MVTPGENELRWVVITRLVHKRAVKHQAKWNVCKTVSLISLSKIDVGFTKNVVFTKNVLNCLKCFAAFPTWKITKEEQTFPRQTAVWLKKSPHISGGPQRSVCSTLLFNLIVVFSVMVINFIPFF